jgi:hypothetical protein
VDFPQFRKDETLHSKAGADRENYLLRSHANGLLLLGSTDLAVRHAVWDTLHRIGYRQYFPGKHWEFVPHTRTLSIDFDVLQKPSYHSRRIWYGFGAWDYAKEPYREWCEKNRCVAGIELQSGHSYDGILSRNKKAFAEHPEYLGLVNGERRSTKCCIANPGYYSVPVPPNADGTLWSFYSCAGDKTLMTVPRFLARNREELLLPREVVEKDSRP